MCQTIIKLMKYSCNFVYKTGRELKKIYNILAQKVNFVDIL